MSKDILSVENITMQFGGVVAVNNLSLHIPEGQIVALIGPNGAGKTTVFNLLTKVYQPTHGTILLNGRDIHGLNTAQINRAGIARTFQNIRQPPSGGNRRQRAKDKAAQRMRARLAFFRHICRKAVHRQNVLQQRAVSALFGIDDRHL